MEQKGPVAIHLHAALAIRRSPSPAPGPRHPLGLTIASLDPPSSSLFAWIDQPFVARSWRRRGVMVDLRRLGGYLPLSSRQRSPWSAARAFQPVRDATQS